MHSLMGPGRQSLCTVEGGRACSMRQLQKKMYKSRGSKSSSSWQSSTFCYIQTRIRSNYDSLEIQQQYNDINNRWDLAAENDWDNENSSARLFERSRIKALAGQSTTGKNTEKMNNPKKQLAYMPAPKPNNIKKDMVRLVIAILPRLTRMRKDIFQIIMALTTGNT
ncbi:SPTB2 protein, partial [Polypterus senegalus]|nr:SPTB2 protein [Polypterus senegalus]